MSLLNVLFSFVALRRHSASAFATTLSPTLKSPMKLHLIVSMSAAMRLPQKRELRNGAITSLLGELLKLGYIYGELLVFLIAATVRYADNLVTIVHDRAAADTAGKNRGHFDQFHCVLGRPSNDIAPTFAQLIAGTVVWKPQCDYVVVCKFRRGRHWQT